MLRICPFSQSLKIVSCYGQRIATRLLVNPPNFHHQGVLNLSPNIEQPRFSFLHGINEPLQVELMIQSQASTVLSQRQLEC